MSEPELEEAAAEETRRKDARWYPVYAAVVVVTALVILALWAFSRAFS